MKLNEIKTLSIELEDWAKKRGWKKAAVMITEHHCGDLLESLANTINPDEYARRLHNNTQIIQRAFRNDTPNYRRQAAALAPAIRAAIEAELEEQNDVCTRAVLANKECIEATSAVLTGKPMQVIRKEGTEAIEAIAAACGLTIQIKNTGPHAA